ncbi:transcriptional regulator [Raineyella sp.]|uniref:transcriptional regulator n=1 Tax=Raineyella sp. TaxID=1911550 RepID=UPI002B1FE28C|nr:transcriptional regulator [Raineyella sp.]MEA5154856.1 transcriptional regulator [Raineyella sp.]
MPHLSDPDIVHAPHRLKALALLAVADTVEFGVLRDHLGVTDSVASKQLKVLTEAGYVVLDKPAGQSGRARTWVRITPAGRRALDGHLEALRELVAAAQGASR